jgi:hypothetical protein
MKNLILVLILIVSTIAFCCIPPLTLSTKVITTVTIGNFTYTDVSMSVNGISKNVGAWEDGCWTLSSESGNIVLNIKAGSVTETYTKEAGGDYYFSYY